MDVSIIIVSYNTSKLTQDCIESIFKQDSSISFEVIMIDNASTDDTVYKISSRFPQVKIIISEENLGFARANNLAIEKASECKYILLLNSDTIILENAIEKIFLFANKKNELGIYGGSTFFSDGSRNPGSCWAKPTLWSTICIATGLASTFPKTKFFNRESYNWWDWTEEKTVDIISGCFLLIQKELWNKLNGFSPDFFMYGEDADLCLRAGNLGYKCHVDPFSKIIHYGGASDNIHAEKMIKLFTAQSMLSQKFDLSKKLTPFLYDIWAFSRMTLFFVIRSFKDIYRLKYDSWKEVFHRRKSWHFN